MIIELNKQFIDNIKLKYYDINNLKNKFIQDTTKLCTDTKQALNQLAYKSSGITGIYSDIITSKKYLYNNYSTIKEDIKNLKTILTKKITQIAYTKIISIQSDKIN